MKLRTKYHFLILAIFTHIATAHILGCGAPSIGNSSSVITNTTTTTITGSYNDGVRDCDYRVTQKLDQEGNVAGCDFANKCSGSDTTIQSLLPIDPDFYEKCVAPGEELPIDDGTGGAVTDPDVLDQTIDNFNDDPIVAH